MIARSDIILCVVSIACLTLGLYRWYSEVHPQTTKAGIEGANDPKRSDIPVTTAMVMPSANTTVDKSISKNPVSSVTPVGDNRVVNRPVNEAQQAPPVASAISSDSETQPTSSQTKVVVLSARTDNPTTNTLSTQAVSEKPIGTIASQQETVVARKTHRVVRGENLTVIARQFGTTVAELKRLNGLGSDRITVGQELLYQ